MAKIILTNNPLVDKKYSKYYEVKYFDVEYLEVLQKARDHIHIGHKLLTHPLSGSIKPNETPYKSIIISKEKEKLDMESLMIIEESIQTADKFINKIGKTSFIDKAKEDFQVVDLSLIDGCFK
ncbi:GrdX family protein [Clostridium sp. D2Q-11]|uniref:GrdX family protein n=1 Tax=Anaeromonas frigoriresistens TaxID=2683708 RepID=A0A942UVW7_9FIRM|nr:GrdX family protein [Anaeromonas frigoriresistens]MBS4537784.1 GrdX family protein [Anaeromonas frigoriresistens]